MSIRVNGGFKMRTLTILFITAILLSACGGEYDPCYGTGADSDACTLAKAQLRSTLQAQESRRVTDATRQAVDLANAQAAAQAQAESTIQSARAQGTQAAINAEATQAAGYAQATQAAINAEATQAAATLEATRSYLSSMATSQAINAEATRSAVESSSQATAQSVAIQATVDAAQVERNRKQQEAEMARFKEFVGSLFSLLAGIAFVSVCVMGSYFTMRGATAWLRNRAGTIRKGPNDAPIIVFDLPNGDRRIVDPDRMIGPSMAADGSGQPDDWRLLDLVTRRDQFVDLWARLSQAQAEGSHPAALPASAPAMLAAGQVMLPDVVDLPEALPQDRLALAVGASGPILATRRDIRGLIVAGAPRSGKSTLLQSLALQAARSGWALHLADPVSNTFLPDVWNRVAALRCEVAEDADRLRGMIELIEDEADRRVALFREIANGGIPPADLEAYNAIASDPLPPMLLMADEFNTFAGDVLEPLTDLARRGQKWGLLVVLAAHSWRARDIPRGTADLLQSRIVFRVNSREAARTVLDSPADASAAVHIDKPGRAVISLNGRTEQGQCYRVRPDAIMALASGAVVAQPLTPKTLSANDTSTVERIRVMREAGASLNTIQREVFGYVGGKAYEQVKAALADTTTT